VAVGDDRDTHTGGSVESMALLYDCAACPGSLI
jgi:hypothetical protein